MNGRKRGVNCCSNCPTRSHYTFADCLMNKHINLSPRISDSYGSRQKSWDRELNSYESAVSQGLSPAGTRQHHVDAATRAAEAS